MEKQIKKIAPGLTTNERVILLMRTGLIKEIANNYNQIGKILGLSRERVRQIDNKLKEKYKFYGKKFG